jgi:rhodanese-related sulfurtransferase
MNAIALQPRNFLPVLALAAVLFLGWQSALQQANEPRLDVKHVTTLEAKALIDAGAVVIDVRDRAASDRLHLPGALLIPVEVLAAHLAQLEAAKTKPIVVYCGNGSSLGPQAATILGQAGFTQVVNLQSGLEGWRAAGLPTTHL